MILEKKNKIIFENSTKQIEFLLKEIDTTGFKMAESIPEYIGIKSNYARCYLKAIIKYHKTFPKKSDLFLQKLFSLFPIDKPDVLFWILALNQCGYEKEVKEITDKLLICYDNDLKNNKNLNEWKDNLEIIQNLVPLVYKQFNSVQLKNK